MRAARLTAVLATIGVCALLGSRANADDIVVRDDGTMYVGTIAEVDDERVVIETTWPYPGTVRLDAAEVRPSSWWQLQTRRVGDDATRRFALAEWAEQEGLPVQALTDYRKVVGVEGFDQRARSAIERLERALAMRLFEQGEGLVNEGRHGASRRYFDIILRRYPESDVAPIAKLRLEEAEGALAASRRADDAARKRRREIGSATRAASSWRADIAAIVAHVEKADAEVEESSKHVRKIRDVKPLRRRVQHLDSAWNRLEALGPAPDEPEADRAERLRDQVRAELVSTCLALGEAALMRGGVNSAEDWCTRACDLDPEGKDGHELHGKIIDALLLSGWYRVSR